MLGKNQTNQQGVSQYTCACAWRKFVACEKVVLCKSAFDSIPSISIKMPCAFYHKLVKSVKNNLESRWWRSLCRFNFSISSCSWEQSAVNNWEWSERRLLGNWKQLGKHYFSSAIYALNLFRFWLTKIGIDGLLFEFTLCIINQWRKENNTVFGNPSWTKSAIFAPRNFLKTL